MTVNCAICGTEAISYNGDVSKDILGFECLRCGVYRITRDAAFLWHGKDEMQIAKLCGWIRENQGVTLFPDDIISLENINSPSIGEKAERLLIELGKCSRYGGDLISYHHGSTLRYDSNFKTKLMGVSWVVNENELEYLIKTYLDAQKNFIRYENRTVTILPAGYDYLHVLSKINPASQICFCAMWFNDETKHLWSEAIRPAIELTGHDAKRIDEHPHNNRIDDEIIAMIRRSKFVVADFTGQRGGVYFEAGFALGMGLPVIWLCRKDEIDKVHFDNRQYNFLIWENDKLDDLQYALQFRIEATLGQGEYQKINMVSP